MATYNDTIDENVNVTSPNDFVAPLVGIISENIDVSDSFFISVYTYIYENLTSSDVLTSRGILVSTVEELAQISEIIQLTFEAINSEVINLTLTDAEILLRLADIIEAVHVADSVTQRGVLNTAIALAFTVADIVEQAYHVEVSELVDVLDQVVDLFVRSAIIIDHIETTLVSQEFVLIGVHALEDIAVLDDTDLQSILSSGLVDEFQFVGAIQSEDLYNTYSFNPEGYGLTTYDNFDFNSMAHFNGKYLLANSTGLFEYGGTTDNLVNIVAKIKTTAIDFGTSSKKQVKKMYLGLTNDSAIVLKVTVDGKGTHYYELDSSTVGLDTQAIKIGKGLVGRYWQFELITKDNSSFELDEVEFIPVEFRRKL